MALWREFIDGTHTSRAPMIDREATINLFRHTVIADADVKHQVLIGTPGRATLFGAPDVGCRGLYQIENQMFGVNGGTFYSVNLMTGTPGAIGTVPNDGKPVSMVSNGRGGEQLAIVTAGQLFIYGLTSGVLSGPTPLPLTGLPIQIDYLDGYFLLVESNSARVWFSNLNNGLVWNALSFFVRSHTNDNVVGLKVWNDVIGVFGSQTSELYYDSGDPLTPFLPYSGTVIPHGAVSPWAIGNVDGVWIWLAQSQIGTLRVVTATAPPATVVSTPEMAFLWHTFPTLADTEILVYQQEHHVFAAFTFPSADVTYVYDVTEQDWHQRGDWDTTTGVFHRWRARGSCLATLSTSTVQGPRILVGDYQNSTISILDLDTFTDNGAMIRRVRQAAYLSSENQWLFLQQVELGLQLGVGLPSGQGKTPTLYLEISRDASETWGSPRPQVGSLAQGQYQGRARWLNCGRVRADALAMRISTTDPVRVGLGPGLWLRAVPGTGNL